MNPEDRHGRRRPGRLQLAANTALLVFLLDDDRFALPCDRVREILPAVAIQALPEAPPIVEGIVNLRGTIVPVLDIRQRFQLASRPLHHLQHFIIAESDGRQVALRVDRALNVVMIDPSTIRPATDVRGAQQVAGIVVVNEGLVVIQDLDQFLTAGDVQALRAALSDLAGVIA